MLFKRTARIVAARVSVVLLAISLISGAAASAAEPKAPAAAGSTNPPADASLILNRNSYFRTYIQFGLMKLNGEVLKTEGENYFGAGPRGIGRIEQLSKKLLASKNYDWSKTDWRDAACYYMFTGQAGDDSSAMATILSIPAPADWAKPEFDDAAFDRMRLGTPLQALEDFREAQSLLFRGVYVRTYFEVPDPSVAGELSVRLVYRGGARIFVNGEEIGRGYLPAGPVTQDTFGADYPAEAYIALPEELPEKPHGDLIGDLRCAFDDARPAEGRKGSTFKTTYGNAVLNRAGWDRLMKLRDRELGPIVIPAKFLRKGRNVLAIEVRTSRYHPILVPTARMAQQKNPVFQGVCERGWGGGMGWNARWNHAEMLNVELRAKSPSVPTCLKRPAGVQVWVDDINHWLCDKDYNPAGFPAGVVRFVGGQNGAYSALVGVGTDKPLSGLHATCGDLVGEGGAKIPAAAMQIHYMVGHGLNEMNQLGFARCDPNEIRGFSPMSWILLYRYANGTDLYGGPLPADGDAAGKMKDQYIRNFKFFDHIGTEPPKAVPANTCQPIWFTLKMPEQAVPGKYKGTVTVEAAGAMPVVLPVEAEAIGWRVPAPREFQTLVQSEQTPYGILKAYKVEAWSEKHWQLIESSFRQLARIGNDWLYVPVLMNTEIGNHEDTMVKAIRKQDGSYGFDFTLMDKYLDLARKIQGRPRMVCFLVMQPASTPSSAVSVLDEATGKTEAMEVGPAQDATRRPYWRAFGAAIVEHMKKLGLRDVMYFGQAFDDIPDKGIIGILAEVAPDVGWTCAGHQRMPDATFRVAARAYGVEVLDKSQQGWKNPYIHLLMPRTGGSVICTEGISPPFSWRVMCDRAIYCGFNGVGRAGADYFDRTWFDGYKGGYWNMAGRGSVMTLWPGTTGVESSARNEAMLEGIQESELRIFLEQALDRKVLPEDLAKETQTALDDHFRGTLHIATGVRDNQTMDIAQNWQNRSRRLYQAAAKVAAKIGIDVDQTEIGAKALTLIGYGQKQSLTGTKISIPALGATRVALKLRNWSDKPRAWKAVAGDRWIVPEKGEGTVSGQQELGITLDGADLKAGSDVSGTLTLTDTQSGTAYPIKITATVVKTLEYQTHQDVRFLTGGGSGAEAEKPVRIVKDPVLNVPAGGSDAKGYLLVNRAKTKLAWQMRGSQPWLATDPASGEMPPESTLAVKIVARPGDKDGAAYDATLTLTAGSGAVKETYPVKVFVIPPYLAQTPPAGTAVYLNDLDQTKFMNDHVDAGFSRNREPGRPWIISDVPVPYYSRFNRSAEPFPEGMKREDYVTFPYQMGGKTFTHGLWVSPTHETRYVIEGAGFKAFAAEVGFYDKTARNSYANLGSVVNFEIYVDGKLRAQSGLMKLGEAPRLLLVEKLENAKEVKLATRRDDLINDWYTVATWGDPRFIRGP